MDQTVRLRVAERCPDTMGMAVMTDGGPCYGCDEPITADQWDNRHDDGTVEYHPKCCPVCASTPDDPDCGGCGEPLDGFVATVELEDRAAASGVRQVGFCSDECRERFEQVREADREFFHRERTGR